MDYKNIKMLVFDNDATLFNHRIGGIEDDVFDALIKLKSKGYKLCLNTSRSYEETYNIPKKLYELMDMVILLAGAYVFNNNKIDIRYIDDDKVKQLINYFDTHDVTYRYCLDNGIGYLNRHDEDKEAIFKRLYNMIPKIKKYENERVIHFIYYALGDTKQDIIKISNGLAHSNLRLGGEIAPSNTGKAYGVKLACEKFNIDPKDVCAFGDGGNDVEMLKYAGLGIAMGNGSDECKQAADYVTEDINENGIVNALKRFEFI